MKPKLQALEKRLNRFLAKQSKENDGFHQLQQSPDYDEFEHDMAVAILAQATWTAKQLHSLEAQYISDDLASLSAEQIAELQQYLDQFMPSIAEAVDNHKVYNWFKQSFTHGVNTVYDAHDLPNDFKLTNPNYLGMIQNDANTLLDKSTLDDTTRKALTKLITEDKAAGMTVSEISADIQDKFSNLSKVRADMIARTETVRMMNQGQYAAMKESGVQTKAWLALGSNPCPICMSNAGDDWIPMTAMFGSGDLMPPAHPRCECSLDYMSIDISPSNVWDGE